MYIDFKVTAWERIEIPEEKEEEFLQAVKDRQISSANDVFNLFPDWHLVCEPVYDTSVQMEPEDNQELSTIELHSGLNNTQESTDIIWENGLNCLE